MKLIVKARQMGKTTEAVKLFKLNPQAAMLVFSMQEKKRLVHEYELKSRQDDILILDHFRPPWDMMRGKPKRYEVLIIDDLELVLTQLFSAPFIRPREIIATTSGIILDAPGVTEKS